MSGIIWHILAFTAAAVFLGLMIFRIVSIIRQPVHLRWELAPIPHEKGKAKYGGSYLEDYEWWQKPRQKSRTAPTIYMLSEIFLLKSVWKNNRPLWPLSLAMHTGLYLIILTLVLYLVNALLMIGEASLSVQNGFFNITTVIVAAGCILGSLGAAGLILKRSIDINLREYSTFSTYFRLVLLAAVFISGATAMLFPGNYADEMSLFVKGIITLDSGITVTVVSAIHILISMLFVIYLPFTDMVHFITKYFTFHKVRWNDEPQDSRMAVNLSKMAAQPITWSANHTGTDDRKSWASLTEETGEKEKP